MDDAAHRLRSRNPGRSLGVVLIGRPERETEDLERVRRQSRNHERDAWSLEYCAVLCAYAEADTARPVLDPGGLAQEFQQVGKMSRNGVGYVKEAENGFIRLSWKLPEAGPRQFPPRAIDRESRPETVVG